MSLIRIFYRDAGSLARLGANMKNAALFAAQNTGVSLIQGRISENALLKGTEELTQEDILNIKGLKSDYPGSSGDLVRNVVIIGNSEVQFTFLDVKMSVRRQNTIKQTPLTGRIGSVKEYIQAKDYEINMRGSIWSKNAYQFPVAELQQLISLLNQPKSFNISSVYLQTFSISKVVVNSIDISQLETNYMNNIPFTISLLSDENYELKVE